MEYELPAVEVKNQLFVPQGVREPNRRPKNRKRPTEREEKILRSLSNEVDHWLTSVLKSKGINRHHFIRKLYGLHLKLAPDLFFRTVKRAEKYRITRFKIIEQIAELLIRQSGYELPEVDIDAEFINPPSYLEGRSSDPVDLSEYDQYLKESEYE